MNEGGAGNPDDAYTRHEAAAFGICEAFAWQNKDLAAKSALEKDNQGAH